MIKIYDVYKNFMNKYMVCNDLNYVPDLTDIKIKKDFVGTTHGTCASEERPGGSENERSE